MAEYIMEESDLRGHIDQYWVDTAAREMVVRCQGCRWSTGDASDCHDFALYRDPNGFCKWGDPKEDMTYDLPVQD